MKKKKPYFAEKEEQAVLDFINSNSFDERNNIYNNILKEPFQKMIQSILRRYPIHVGNFEMEEVEAYALSHLVEHMVKFKPFIIGYKSKNDSENKWIKSKDKNKKFIFIEDAEEKLEDLNKTNDEYDYKILYGKAYSYCQTIVRNYFKDHGRKTFSEKKINLFYDDYIDEIHKNSDYYYEIDGDEHYILDDLINTITNRIEDKISDENTVLKDNEIIVGEAIINILKNWNVLFLEEGPDGRFNKKVSNKFAKNKILFYLKEQTGLSTKEIRMGIKPFKEIYFLEKNTIFDD